MADDNLRTCLRCGRVAFGIPRLRAEAEVVRFNLFFATLSEKQRHDYYGGKSSTISDYEHCVACGNPFSNFRAFRPGDCPNGCTLSPIIIEEMNNEEAVPETGPEAGSVP